MFLKSKKNIFILSFFIILMGVVLFVILYNNLISNKEPLRPKYEEFTIEKTSIKDLIKSSGNLSPYEFKTVLSLDGGTVQDVFFDSGEDVKKGDELIVFEPIPANFDLERQKLTSKQLNIHLKQLNEQLSLHEENIIIESPSDGNLVDIFVKEGDFVQPNLPILIIEDDNGDLFEVKSKISSYIEKIYTSVGESVKEEEILVSFFDDKQIQYSIDKIKIDIQKTKNDIEQIHFQTKTPSSVIAPIDGTVAEINVQKGQKIGPSTPIAHLINYNLLNLPVAIDELDIIKVKENQTVNIYVDAIPNQTFIGKVQKIAKQGNFTDGVTTFEVTIEIIEQNSLLKSGMNANVEIIVEEKNNTFVVPNEAVFEKNDKFYVLLKTKDNKNKEQEVEVGIYSNDFVEVTQGINVGDIILIEKHDDNYNTGSDF